MDMRRFARVFLLKGDLQMAKKLLCVLAALCLVIGLASCNGDVSVPMDGSGNNVASNGGFVVETGDYVYFINGVESYTTTYKAGSVTKAALCRVKKSALSALGGDGIAESEVETVVSRLMVSGDKTAGFYIYGDYVYYAVPSAENDSSGNVKSSKLNFFRTRLNGSDTSGKLTGNTDYSNSVTFRYIAAGDKVYLAVYDNYLYIYDASSGNLVYSYEKAIDELIFDEDNASSDIFFTIKPVNENLYDPDSADAKQADYQEIRKVSLGNNVTESVALNGAGKYVVTGGDDLGGQEGGIGLTGATFDLIRHKGGTLYFSYTILDSTLASTTYVALDDGKIGDAATTWTNAQEEENVLNYGDKNASKVFADTSYICDKNTIYFIDSTYGLMKYDYTRSGSDDSDFGVTSVYYSDAIKGGTLDNVVGDYLYFYDSSNNYYRVSVAAIASGEAAEETRLNTLPISNSWYKPEVVTDGDRELLFVVYTGTPYSSYCYAIDMNAVEAAYAVAEGEDKDKFYDAGTTYEWVTGIVGKTLVGKMSQDDKTAYENHVDGLQKESDAE